jgi:hypothetical protein
MDCCLYYTTESVSLKYSVHPNNFVRYALLHVNLLNYFLLYHGKPKQRRMLDPPLFFMPVLRLGLPVTIYAYWFSNGTNGSLLRLMSGSSVIDWMI